MRNRAQPQTSLRAFTCLLALAVSACLPPLALADNAVKPPNPADTALLARMTLIDKMKRHGLGGKGG